MGAGSAYFNDFWIFFYRHGGILNPKKRKAHIAAGFHIETIYRQYYLFENWYLFLAPERPGFFLSTALGSLVRNPAAFNSGRNPG